MLPDGRRAVPVFQLVAERYLDPGYAPEAVAETCGVPAATIRRLAAEMARTAFEEEIELAVPWTDWAGRRHETMRGRPVSLHAMRGISAHSNGFQTCRALHLLQMLLGTIDVPGGWRYKSPHPKPAPPGPKPAGRPEQVAPGKPLPGIPLGYPLSPEDLILDADGRPFRIDKAFSWDAPIAAHGMMQMVITNAWKGDPYPIDTLFMYMANMAWNSAMNTAETMRMLTDKDPATGEYRIPRIIYSDAYYSETVAYADLVLPDTTYLERWDCISLLDRPIGGVEGPADAIRQPVLTPDRDVRPFQDVLIEIGARLGLPGFVTPEGAPRYPGGYPDYIVNHERRPGVGPLGGWRGAEGENAGRGAPNPHQLQRYIANGCFWKHELPEDQLYFKHANKAYLETAVTMGLIDKPEPIVLQLYVEPLQRFRLAAQGHGKRAAAGDPPRADRDLFRPAAVLVHAVRGSPDRSRHFPAARADPAADADVPFLALAECLAAADPRQQPAVREPGGRARARAGGGRLGLAVEPSRPDPRPDQADGWGQSRHGVDLERDRQAQRRMEPRSRLARVPQGLPAQPPDLRAAAAGWRLFLRQCRPDHRPSRLV